MRKRIFTALTSCCLLSSSQVYLASQNILAKYDLPPDASGSQYLNLLESNLSLLTNTDPDLQPILDIGKRNWDWLNHMNTFRSTDDQLEFSSPSKSRSFPITSSRNLSKDFVLSEYNKLFTVIPKEMLDILLKKQDLTNDLPSSLSKDDYLKYGLIVDYAYQNAARWNLLFPYKDELKAVRFKDIRGYYHLEHLIDRTEKLENFNNLIPEEQKKIGVWLENQCLNTEHDESNCHQYFTDSLVSNNGDATVFYQKYFNNSQKIYQNFFQIPTQAVRNDILWTDGPNQTSFAIIPFQDLEDVGIKIFLHNIEKEWRWGSWQLLLQYTNGDNIPNITFESGVTPHVNDLGGNNIVMDSNQPLTEWDAQWTIRHEFGHVLGFPDCYIEFYDENNNAFVSYQIDVNNLMCSRRGKLQETHYSEMTRNYFTKL
ncbi:MAG: hypothetical protein KBD64_04740 [Gammaproteobacteria bacterium]|nr:hypothetical protein [Gammaproteobacteria bacterium]